MKIKDSGLRREFETGAVRDVQEGKGRCDLLPLDVIADCLKSRTLRCIDDYIRTGETNCLLVALYEFIGSQNGQLARAMLDIAIHFEEGATKYGERNWEKGIPLHCYIDSAVRHYLKYIRGDKDEPHERAFIWNLLCAIWTHEHKPEMIDLPFNALEISDDNFSFRAEISD